jgi:hypothetical protein
MALYVLTCEKCGNMAKRLLDTSEEANAGKPCKQRGCGGTMHRTPSAPSLHNKEVLKHGHQIKDVERFSDAAQLYDERAHQDDRKPK